MALVLMHKKDLVKAWVVEAARRGDDAWLSRLLELDSGLFDTVAAPYSFTPLMAAAEVRDVRVRGGVSGSLPPNRRAWAEARAREGVDGNW
jgi:hypothetical protein